MQVTIKYTFDAGVDGKTMSNDKQTSKQDALAENEELKSVEFGTAETCDECAAKVAEIERLNKICKSLGEQIDRRDTDREQERLEYNEKIEQLEKQIVEAGNSFDLQLERSSKWHNLYSETAAELCNIDIENRNNKLKIAELEKQIPPRYDPEKEYTEDELREILNYEIEVFKRNALDAKIASFNYGALYIELAVDDDDKIFGHMNCNFRPFKQPLKPPSEGRAVLTMHDEETADKYTLLMFSCGELGSDGRLKCANGGQSLHVPHWCDYSDRSHHSAGWDRSWEPES